MIALSTVDIEKQITDYKLEFYSLKDDEIEWHYQPPAFVVAFVQFIDLPLTLISASLIMHAVERLFS